jgi:hypothetical protein
MTGNQLRPVGNVRFRLIVNVMDNRDLWTATTSDLVRDLKKATVEKLPRLDVRVLE